MEDTYKEVYFHEYCDICEYKDLPEDEDPCDECLMETVNLYSHKPVYFKERQSRK